MGARDQHGVGSPWGEFHVIGKPNRKVDALDKATGAAVYTDDIALLKGAMEALEEVSIEKNCNIEFQHG